MGNSSGTPAHEARSAAPKVNMTIDGARLESASMIPLTSTRGLINERGNIFNAEMFHPHLGFSDEGAVTQFPDA
jgi:hypothetical protein